MVLLTRRRPVGVACAALLLVALPLGACSDSDQPDTGGAPATSTSTTPPSGPPAASDATTATTTDIGDPVARAQEVCEARIDPSDPARSAVIAAAPMTADDVATQLADAGADPEPWRALPPAHFVAYCEISRSTSPEAVPTTMCPDGAVVLDVSVEATFNDLEGRTTDAAALRPSDPCIAPTDLP